MASQVYTFHVSYKGLEDRIWRKISVSSNYQLDHLGYLVLAAFDAKEGHLFEFLYDDVCFSTPSEKNPKPSLDMATFKLSHLNLQEGSLIRMDCDLEAKQAYVLELVNIEDMKRNRGKHYPFVIDGAGFCIIDDFSLESQPKKIEQTYQNSHSNESIYYDERTFTQDYCLLDLKSINASLKYDIDMIASRCALFRL